MRRFAQLGPVLVLLLAASAPFPAAAQTLPQMVEQLRANPGDEALRRKIIETALGTKPAPAIPEDARRFLAYGSAAFKMAGSPEDLKLAAAEFRKAADVAPWWPDPYYNAGSALEKAGDPAGAMAAFRLYLAAAPNAADAEKVKTRVYELEYMSGRAVAAEGRAAAEKASMSGLLRSLEGALFYNDADAAEARATRLLGHLTVLAMRISNGQITCGLFIPPGNMLGQPGGFSPYKVGELGVKDPAVPLDGLAVEKFCDGSTLCRTGATIEQSFATSYSVTIARDGKSLTRKTSLCPQRPDVVMQRH